MSITIKLRTAPGECPYNEIDLTDRALIYEESPEVMDILDESYLGERLRSRRAIRRRFRVSEMQRLTTAEVNLLRRWVHDRVRVCLNPNYNGATTFYTRMARNDVSTGLPEPIIGPSPTFTRTTSDAAAFATRRNDAGRISLVGTSVPRYERGVRGIDPLYPMAGLRVFTNAVQYLAKSHPIVSDLVWIGAGATFSWQWAATLPSIVDDAPMGTGLFMGNVGDRLEYVIGAGYGASQVSAGVWVRGEGSVSLQMTGGAVGEGTTVTLQANVWSLVKCENITADNTAVTLRLNAKSAGTWCSVSLGGWGKTRRVINYLYYVGSSGNQSSQMDNLYYPFQVPHFPCTMHIGVQMPDLYAGGGEQVAIGMDASAGNRFMLKYDPTILTGAGGFHFQKKTSGVNVQWTPERSAGLGTIISVYMSSGLYVAYENGNFKASAAGAQHSIPLGLYVGYDGNSSATAWGGLVYFVRFDEGPLDITEISYISSLFNDTAQQPWTRSAEGRVFELEDPQHRMRAATNFTTFRLSEVASHTSATQEEP